MPFTGKATYTAGAALPELAEDVSDLVSISSPHETALLDALGDPTRPARSTQHEWLEDSLLPNSDTLTSFNAGTNVMTVPHVDRFRAGDQIRIEGEQEVMLVTAVTTGSGTITVSRNYGGSGTGSVGADDTILILGNAALEGDDAASARFTTRSRQSNYTQIFTATVDVSGSELAVTQVGVRDELDYQKSQRTRELIRDLENCVINGRAPAANPQGSSTVRRSMRGLVSFISTNVFVPGVDGFPAETSLSEEQLNLALRQIWTRSSGQVDLILVGGVEKRAINGFIDSNRRFVSTTDTLRSMVNVYESDFGMCRVVLSRWVPAGTVLLLDSSRIDVLPLAGRHFHFKPLASTGDREGGQVLGEYTVELRNESAHGVIRGLS